MITFELNKELVKQRIKEKGLNQTWIFKQTGLGRTAGYQMIREGVLPKSATKLEAVLGKLALILDVHQSQLIVSIDPRRD